MNRINLKKLAATAAISGALGLSALRLGAGVANADDGWGPWGPWIPWHPGDFGEHLVPWGGWGHWGHWGGDDWGEWGDD